MRKITATLCLCFFILFIALWHVSRLEFRHVLPKHWIITKPLGSTIAPTPKEKIESVLIVFWSTVFGTRIKLNESWKRGQCPVECTVTSDISRAKDASTFIVHARDPHPLPPRDNEGYQRKPRVHTGIKRSQLHVKV